MSFGSVNIQERCSGGRFWKANGKRRGEIRKQERPRIARSPLWGVLRRNLVRCLEHGS
jgi:hypothetical protein